MLLVDGMCEIGSLSIKSLLLVFFYLVDHSALAPSAKRSILWCVGCWALVLSAQHWVYEALDIDHYFSRARRWFL